MKRIDELPRGHMGIAAMFLVLSAIVFAIGMTKVTVWAIADSLGEQPGPHPMHAWAWFLMTAAAIQLVLAGPIGRLLMHHSAPASRIVFDLFSLIGGGAVVYVAAVDGAPFLYAAIGIAVCTVWIIVKLKEGWLDWLVYAWLLAVALVLAAAMYKASYPYAFTWIAVMCSALLAVRAAIRVAKDRHPAFAQ